MSHVKEHCDTPKITRQWKRLGEGAVWTCSCGELYRLTLGGGYDRAWWGWRKVVPS